MTSLKKVLAALSSIIELRNEVTNVLILKSKSGSCALDGISDITKCINFLSNSQKKAFQYAKEIGEKNFSASNE